MNLSFILRMSPPSILPLLTSKTSSNIFLASFLKTLCSPKRDGAPGLKIIQKLLKVIAGSSTKTLSG